ncbi:hypothetical protein BJ912DRAFT_998867 [Pholiota molesta]|nr:hypothetical protein BJ912DRAFT_998867 [Pholiota molesta]
MPYFIAVLFMVGILGLPHILPFLFWDYLKSQPHPGSLGMEVATPPSAASFTTVPISFPNFLFYVFLRRACRASQISLPRVRI